MRSTGILILVLCLAMTEALNSPVVTAAKPSAQTATSGTITTNTVTTSGMSTTTGTNPIVGNNKCTYGPSFWCTSYANANSCGSGAVAFCNSVNWVVQPASTNGGSTTTGTNNNAVKTPTSPSATPIVGTNQCTNGPSFWCQSLANAQSCGSGAVAHCNSVGWKTG